MSRAAWGEGAEYEMMDMEPPQRHATVPIEHGKHQESTWKECPEEETVGLIGIEDRIVRIGFSIALTYLAITWFGIRSLAMWVLTVPVLYFVITSMVGKDPIYTMFGLTTKVE